MITPCFCLNRSLLSRVAQQIFDQRGDHQNDNDPNGNAH
jgi:hypothetical protein